MVQHSSPDVGDDDIFCQNAPASDKIRFVQWADANDFQTKLLEVLQQELGLSDLDDIRGFNAKLGAVAIGEYDYFNATRDGKLGSVDSVEAWQILSPLRGMSFASAISIGRFTNAFARTFSDWPPVAFALFQNPWVRRGWSMVTR